MVASYHEGTLVRTYIRVPGSGTDVRAKPALCDLSRVSTVVAPLPLHTGIGFITTNSTVNLKNKTHISTPSCVNVQRTKRPRKDGNDSSPIHKKKKRCVQPHKSSTEVESDKLNNQQRRKTYDWKKSDSTISATELPEDHSLEKIEKESRNCDSTMNENIKNESLLHQNKELLLKKQASEFYQLLIKRHQLNQDNIALQRQITLFKQLIKDTNRLKSVINKLNCQNNQK